MTISRFKNSRLRNFLLQVQDFSWFSGCRQTATETTTKITQAHQTLKKRKRKKSPTPFPPYRQESMKQDTGEVLKFLGLAGDHLTKTPACHCLPLLWWQLLHTAGFWQLKHNHHVDHIMHSSCDGITYAMCWDCTACPHRWFQTTKTQPLCWSHQSDLLTLQYK